MDVAGQILCYSFLRDTLNRYEEMTAEQQSELAPALFVIMEYFRGYFPERKCPRCEQQ